MKLGKAVIDGKEYPLVFSTRVLVNLKERTGKDFGAFLNDASDIEQVMRLLADLIAAGCKYSKDHGMDAPEPLGYDTLLDVIAVDDFGKIFKSLEDLSHDKADIEVVSKNV